MATAMAIGGTILLAILIICLIKKSVREKVGEWFVKKRCRLMFLPLSFLCYYSLTALLAGKWDLASIARIAMYFGLPTLLLYLTGPLHKKERSVIIDLAIVLLLWLPVELRFVQKSLAVDAMKYPLVAFSAIVFGLIVYGGWRKLELCCDLALRKKDLACMAKVSLILAVIILPLGFATGFIDYFGFNPALAPYFWAIPLMFLAICYAPGFAEELIFRGLIQNLLGKKLNALTALIVASLIFGFAHINNRAGGFSPPNYHYIFFAAIAGFGYGFVYWRTKSLVASAVLHAFVDTVWLVLLKGVR